MKQDHNNHQPSSILRHRRSFTWKNTTTSLRTHYILISYIILLVLTYLLGYFSGSSSKQTLNKVTIPTPPPTVKTIPTTGFTAVNNCPPSTSAFPTEYTNYHNDFGPRCENPVQPEFIRSVIIDRVFNGTSPYENFPPPHVAGLLKPKRVKGWGSYGAVFENLIKKTRPRIIVEVGTFLGASAIHMAELTRKLGIETDILCVDDFRGWPGFKTRVNYVPSVNGDVLLYYQFMQNVVSFNLTESIVPVPFSTGSALGKLCEWGVLADLIEVDAGHDFHSAWSDINLAYKLLRPGGVMFGHDYFTAYDNKGVRRAVDLFAKVHGFKVSTDGQHWVLDDRSFYV